MRILVCGGRDYADRGALFEALDRLHAERPITIVVHGACVDGENKLRGADGLAEQWAISREVSYFGVPAKWKQEGRSAGPKRNAEMLNRTQPKVIVAASGGRGTADMVSRAKAARIEVIEVKAK